MTKSHDRCLNCGAVRIGQYCGQCGQRSTTRLISLWELVRDAFGDLFELDSRLWRTLLPLLGRPGRLTREYLEGRRARYMPPFRMYLVLSLLFFVIAFFNPQREFEIFFEPESGESAAPAPAGGDAAPLGNLTPEERREVRAALDGLIDRGLLDESVLETEELGALAGDADGTPADEVPAGDAPAPPPAPAASDDRETNNLRVSIDSGDLIDCEHGNYNLSDLPAWLQRRLTPERLQHLCERWQVAGTDGVTAAVLDRVPAALILLLPLMALVQKLLYPLSRRYYVEHLLFFVHFHSFLFLLLTLQVLWTRLVGMLGLNAAIGVLPVVATSLYVPFYLFVAMRRVYGQGRFFTFVKFSVLAIAYLVSFSMMMLGAVVLAVVSV
ncbi:MAG TPA: DUF3667 domain-containing protein [Woeseiaceae bacterium]|nr:DUF3667 domain-containing protein [Woeseiaceae bacterium]